jgi:anti-anti-sigma factor
VRIVQGPGDSFNVSREGDAVHLQGDLCFESGESLSAALEELVEPDGTLDVDMSGVTFMDLAGLRLLVRAARARGVSSPMVLHSPPPHVIRLMRATQTLNSVPGLEVVVPSQRR